MDTTNLIKRLAQGKKEYINLQDAAREAFKKVSIGHSLLISRKTNCEIDIQEECLIFREEANKLGVMNPPHSRAVGYHVGFADNMKGLFEHSSHP